MEPRWLAGRNVLTDAPTVRRITLCATALFVLGSCTSTSSVQDATAGPDATTSSASPAEATTAASDTAASTANEVTANEVTAVETTTLETTTLETTTLETTTAPTTTVGATTVPPTTAPPTTTPPTTTLEPIPDTVFDASCVVRAAADSSLERVARGNADDPTADIDVTGLWIENGFVGTVAAGDLVDVCIGNGVNDIDGSAPPADSEVNTQLVANVERQQQHLNALFAPFGAGDLAVDGDSGSRTGQRLCGARVALGLDISTADMSPGSDEQATLFSTLALPTPASNAIESERWVLIDRTCQMMFVGNGSTLAFAFNTSTGSAGFETRLQDRAEAFRFNPAVDNGGWHDSSEFPVGVDNPLNGNMYKPLYFDLGQAIHGANNVPASPQSKGCARLSVSDQNTLVDWLGLADAPDETWRKSEMNVTVSVQGDYVPR